LLIHDLRKEKGETRYEKKGGDYERRPFHKHEDRPSRGERGGKTGEKVRKSAAQYTRTKRKEKREEKSRLKTEFMGKKEPERAKGGNWAKGERQKGISASTSNEGARKKKHRRGKNHRKNWHYRKKRREHKLAKRDTVTRGKPRNVKTVEGQRQRFREEKVLFR